MMHPKISVAGREVLMEVIGVPESTERCECRLYFQGIKTAELPSSPEMEAFAQKYLRGGYEETWRLTNYLAFRTRSGFSDSERTAFLGAVCQCITVDA